MLSQGKGGRPHPSKGTHCFAGSDLRHVEYLDCLDGHPAASQDKLFTGPTAIAYSADPIAATKVAVAFAKEKDKFVLVGGFMGQTLLDEQGVKALATLPSLDELRGKLIGLIQAPATKIAGVLQAPGAQLARVISAYASKDAA